jgi:SH3-like domain-containing protein
MKLAASCVLFLLSGFLAVGASAAEYRSVAGRYGVCYDLPQEGSKKLAIASQGLPLEVIFEHEKFVKVRDSNGRMSWMEKTALSKTRRMLIVTVPLADIHLAAGVESAVLFRVAQNVLLELKQNTDTGWLEVRHPDGLTGFIKSTEVWGE